MEKNPKPESLALLNSSFHPQVRHSKVELGVLCCMLLHQSGIVLLYVCQSRFLHFLLLFNKAILLQINGDLTIRSGSFVSRLELDHPTASIFI